MTKNYFILFAFGTIIFSVGCFINDYYILSAFLATISIAVLLFTCYVYSAKIRKECILFLIIECALMFLDNNISCIVHVEFIFFSSLTYSIICTERHNELMFSIKTGLFTVGILFVLMALEEVIFNFAYGFSTITFSSYCPIMLSILVVWLFSYIRKLLLKH